MDTRTAVGAIVANTVELATWCELQAQALDRVYADIESRPLSPQECREIVRAQSEILRRIGQRESLLLALLPGVTVSAPVASVSWWRRWLRRVVG